MSYKQAELAYMQGKYDEAAGLIEPLMESTPEDPKVRLLRGHIYCYGLQDYRQALADYEAVTGLTQDPSFIDYANQGAQTCREFGGGELSSNVAVQERPAEGDDAQWDGGFGADNLNGNGFGGGAEIGGDLSFDDISFDNADFQNTAPVGHEASSNGASSGEFDAGQFAPSEPDGFDFAPPVDEDDDAPMLMGSGEGPMSQGFDGGDDFLGNDSTGGFDFAASSLEDSGEAIALGSGEALSADEDSFAANPFGDSFDDGTDADFGTAPAQQTAPATSDPFAMPDAAFPEVDEGAMFGGADDEADDLFSLESSGNDSLVSDVPELDSADEEQNLFSASGNDTSGAAQPGLAGAEAEMFASFNESASSDANPTGLAPASPDSANGDLAFGSGLDFDANDDPMSGLFDPDEQEPLANPPSVNPANAPEATLFVDATNLDDFEPGGGDMEEASRDETFDMFSMDEAGLDTGGLDSAPSLDFGDTPETDVTVEAAPYTNDADFAGKSEFDTFAGQMPSIDGIPMGEAETEAAGTLQDGLDFAASEMTSGDSTGGNPAERTDSDFLNEFDAFDDFGGLSDFDLAEDSIGFTSPAPSSGFDMPTGDITGGADDLSGFTIGTEETSAGSDAVWNENNVPSFAAAEGADIEPAVAVGQGALAPLENASFGAKRTVLAGAAGLAAAVGVLGTNVAFTAAMPDAEERAKVAPFALALVGGIGGFVGAGVVGEIIRRQVRRSTEDLQTQFSKVVQGNFNTQATIYSEDELGQLSASFNNMSRVILATTKEAQRKAEEQEQQKEDLQRQVIRLLDDVEGAARGDLTVQAEVTADVLGAVADSFNLTIQNLREIVLQVKTAATQVNKASSDNETFARSLSSDALRQAEELAVTLNSVQIMTDSIQRVADSAREAEEVARTASATALKGGEAVEKTVAGILQIRETVAETTRKVKRLAESSQEISKIVALISAIASRTNLLALNASIEAARAGDAGRGFAIVADEVRQLADRAAKSSKEIEQIVLQIQGETGSVMVAMEEGTQQVITGTKLAEQAKRSLDDIIQVSNRIDQLVRSITADTVEQTETSRQVAQVMQSVELTAQETSQEAQRVSRSLHNLVGVASDLQTSVERFRVEESDEL